MSVTIAGIEFENHEYDAHANVLYLDVAGYEGARRMLTRRPRGTESSTTGAAA